VDIGILIRIRALALWMPFWLAVLVSSASWAVQETPDVDDSAPAQAQAQDREDDPSWREYERAFGSLDVTEASHLDPDWSKAFAYFILPGVLGLCIALCLVRAARANRVQGLTLRQDRKSDFIGEAAVSDYADRVSLDDPWFAKSEPRWSEVNRMRGTHLRLATVFTILLILAELVGFGSFFYTSWWGEPDIGKVTDSGWTAVKTGGGGRFRSARGAVMVHLIKVDVRGRTERFSVPYRIDKGSRVQLMVSPSSVSLGSAPSANFTLSMIAIAFCGIAIVIFLSFLPPGMFRKASSSSPD
jgi:hypothetical protein